VGSVRREAWSRVRIRVCVRGGVEICVPANVALFLVRVLVATESLRLEEFLVAKEAREEAHIFVWVFWGGRRSVRRYKRI
jgi:hypothetical protein